MKLKKITNGFTLAEVLVTLAIIGVVAVLTIPSLVTKVQDQRYKTAWKKSYSSISQAIIKLINDNEGTMIGVNGSNVRILRDKLDDYLSVAKSCGFHTTLGDCWHTAGVVKDLKNGNDTLDLDENEAGFILSDGTLINLGFLSDGTCNSHFGLSGTIKYCNRIGVDVNGFKGPNIVGKDVFSFYIMKDRIVPAGVDGDMNETEPSATCPDDGVSFGNYIYPGAGCAAKYLMK